MSEPILKVKGLKVHFPVSGGFLAKKQIVKAVDGVDFEIAKGETFGLVGESGCGKSTTGRALVKIYEPTAGKVIFEGEDITKIKGAKLKEFRRDMQMIFQDPYASLNPRMTVGEIIREPMDIHGIYDTKEEREKRVRELLEIVGLKPDHIRRYPHEFSGGQRQRIGIARTLALNPKFIVCDEPISALDVSIQAQVINLLEKIQAEMGIAYLFIAHDLSMVKHISDRVAVMYAGKIIEYGTSDDIFYDPKHPYTWGLLSAMPDLDTDDDELYTIHTDVDIAKAKEELQGTNTGANFGENYIYAEAIITAALYSREKYKGTGVPDLYCTPHLVNVMLLARDLNGRRIYDSKADLAAALNVGAIHTVEQFEGLERSTESGSKKKLLGLFVNLSDYQFGSTKGGEITRFENFDMDFNKYKYMLETRVSGSLTKVYSAIALEEPAA